MLAFCARRWRSASSAARQLPPPASPAPPAPAGQRGGGGRGRGAVPVMTLTSSAWPDGGQIPAAVHAGGRRHLAAARVERRARRRRQLRADRARRRRGDRQRHGRPAPLAGLEYSRHGDVVARARAVDVAAAGRHAADQRNRPVLSGPRRAGLGLRPTTTSSSCSRSIRCWTSPRSARRRPTTRAAVVAAMAGHIRGKAVCTGLFKRR